MPTLDQNSPPYAYLVLVTDSIILLIAIDSLQGFGVGTAAVGMTISTYALARLMMNLPAGILADRHGRKLLLVWGPAITALGRHLHSTYCLLKLLELLLAYVHTSKAAFLVLA